MFLRIAALDETYVVGMHVTMSLIDNKTAQLWQGFMPKRKEIKHPLNNELYSLEVYDSIQYFAAFNPAATFEKWAAVAVSNHDDIPEGMDVLCLPTGQYAVFLHKGPASNGLKTYQYIFGTWLPESNYVLEHRPHFALMGDKYINNHPDSEEEIWIPVRMK